MWIGSEPYLDVIFLLSCETELSGDNSLALSNPFPCLAYEQGDSSDRRERLLCGTRQTGMDVSFIFLFRFPFVLVFFKCHPLSYSLTNQIGIDSPRGRAVVSDWLIDRGSGDMSCIFRKCCLGYLSAEEDGGGAQRSSCHQG